MVEIFGKVNQMSHHSRSVVTAFTLLGKLRQDQMLKDRQGHLADQVKVNGIFKESTQLAGTFETKLYSSACLEERSRKTTILRHINPDQISEHRPQDLRIMLRLASVDVA